MLCPFLVLAKDEVTAENVVGEDYFYGLTFDNLVMDFDIILEESNILTDMVVKNYGDASTPDEIEKVVLWFDDGNGEFDGYGYDIRLSEAEYDSEKGYWNFTSIGRSVQEGSNKFFVTVETAEEGTIGKTFKFKILPYDDLDEDEDFDIGERGMFFHDPLELPEESVTSNSNVSYKPIFSDRYDPVIAITNMRDNKSFTSTDVFFNGQARDQGNSAIEKIEICVDSQCEEVSITEVPNLDWDYTWEDLSVGSHQVYAKAYDEEDNEGVSPTYNFTVQITQTEEETTLDETTEEEETGTTPSETTTAVDFTNGRWLKLPSEDAVYFINNNNNRYVYPFRGVWESYFGNDFSRVEITTSAYLALYPLVGNVTFKVGSLIKIPSVKNVYIVRESAVIDWIGSESKAIELYGGNWAGLVYDVPESFSPDYTQGVKID